MRPGTGTPSPAAPRPLLRAAQPYLSLPTVQALRPARLTPLPPNLPPCPGEPLPPGLEPSTGGGRGKPRSAGWHLGRALLNPDISPSHASPHLPRGPGTPREEPVRTQSSRDRGLAHPGQRGEVLGGSGRVIWKRSLPRAEIPSPWSIPPPTRIQSWKLSSLEKNLLKLIGCKHN